jgi:hypothetical protein
MGPSTDEIHQELTETREGLDQRIDLMETRAASSARRFLPAAAGVAAVALAAGVILVARSRRQPTLLGRLARVREGFAVRVPPVRVAIGDRAFADERRLAQWQELAMRFAQSAGTAAGSAALGYAVRRMLSGGGEQRDR